MKKLLPILLLIKCCNSFAIFMSENSSQKVLSTVETIHSLAKDYTFGSILTEKPTSSSAIKKAAINIFLGRCANDVVLVAHELGHAIVGAIVTGKPCPVNLGSLPEYRNMFSQTVLLPNESPLISLSAPIIGKINIYRSFLNIFKKTSNCTAYVNYPKELNQAPLGAKILCSLAGPISGIATAIGITALTYKIRHNELSLQGSCTKAIRNLTLDPASLSFVSGPIFSQAFNLVPTPNSGSDGELIVTDIEEWLKNRKQ